MDDLKKPYGYVYLTTNTLNGMQYIGQHGGIFDPRYKGSGTALVEDLKKFGREHFTVSLICYAYSFEELNEMEHFYINEHNAVESPMYYNMADVVPVLDLRTDAAKNYLSFGVNHEKPVGFGDKMREVRNRTNERKGDMYWVTDGISEHLVNDMEHRSMYPSFYKGRLGNTVYMHCEDKTVKIDKDKIDHFLSMGYSIGKSPSIVKNICKSRQHEVWSYYGNEFSCARELTEFLRNNGYPNIVKGTVVNISKGVFVKTYSDLCGRITRRPKNCE